MSYVYWFAVGFVVAWLLLGCTVEAAPVCSMDWQPYKAVCIESDYKGECIHTKWVSDVVIYD